MNKDPQLYNSRIVKIYLEFLKVSYPDLDIDSLLDYAGIAKYEVEDPAHWFTQKQADRFHDILVEKTGNANIARDAGRFSASSAGLGAVKQYVMGLMNPAAIYLLMSKIYPTLSRGATIISKRLGPSKVEILATPAPGVDEKPYQCQNRIGSFEAVAKFFTASFAKIAHPTCFHRGDDCCRYTIQWEKTSSSIWRRIRNASVLLSFLASFSLFFLLPTMTWLALFLQCALLIMTISLHGEHFRTKELTKTIETQGDIAKKHLNEMNIRYNNALLIQELGQATSTIPDIDHLMKAVVGIMEKRLDFDRGMVMLANEFRTKLLYSTGYGYSENDEEIMRKTEFHLDKPDSRGLFVLAFNEQKPFLVNDINELKDDFSLRSQDLAKQLGVQSLICVPITYEKDSLGIIAVDNLESKRLLTNADLNLLMGVAAQTALSITNAISYQKLQKSEEKYRIILESIEEGYYEVDLAGNFTLANGAACNILGYGCEELLGMNNREFTSPENAQRMYHFFNKVYDTGKPSGVTDYEIVRKDGSTRVLEMSTALMRDIKGEPIGFQGVARDVTVRKQSEEALRESEEKYRLLVENANDAIFIVQDSAIKFPNPRTVELLGYSRVELDQKSFSDFVHPEDKILMAEMDRSGTEDDGIPATFSFRILNRIGLEHWMQLNVVPILWEGRPATLNFLRDITLQKKLEAQVQNTQRLEAIGTLAGGIAHDFNNLLMGIQGNASLVLLDTPSMDPQYEKLKYIEQCVQNGVGLTKQLLGFARGGKYEVKPTDLNKLVEESSNMFGRTKKEISIHRKLEEDLWPIEVDSSQIEQVLLNLYVNAWHAMPGGGELFIESKNTLLDALYVEPFKVEPGRYVQVSVTDTGVGIDKKTQERIFDPFFTTKSMGRGTGLGLASVYGIISNHSGIINVHSEKGSGTTFNIYLPASDKKLVEEKKTFEETYKGDETILLVDDEDIILDTGGKMLSSLGYGVYTANGGKEALSVYLKNMEKIDMVVLDMVMPDLGGAETFDKLKEKDPSIKVLLSSGYSVDGQATDILNRGCDGFIQKPFSLKLLSKKLREILDNDQSIQSAQLGGRTLP